ncbi:LysR family transcriptional regulator [Pacificoceanicola onchidii]|uniref:LysR family transcriptional regulator n=1 Tax=Pacificoceanicola onchidii TaxID=2562685 RepID=UPI0010A34BF7|nr:LysR family transcriptional regulator [Pacificoceanicola onchidii]
MPVTPRRPKGPPLNALRAFESAARLGSFTAAAEELGVSAGAISQHVKTIETWAGIALFERRAQGVALLPHAQKLALSFTDAFDQLAAATQNLRGLAPHPDVHIAALPSIAQLWLPARLGRLRAARPDLNISVTAMETPPHLSRELFDLSIFFGVPDETADQLVLSEDRLFPVASPGLASELDMQSAPLLHDQTWASDWQIWACETGTAIGNAARGPRYSLYALAVEEAKTGAGVLMGHANLIEAPLRSGQLVRVSDQDCPSGQSLIISLPHRSRRHPDTDTILHVLTADD